MKTIIIPEQIIPDWGPEPILCNECDGEGFIYYKSDGNIDVRIDADIFVAADPDYERRYCPVCHGNRYVDYGISGSN